MSYSGTFWGSTGNPYIRVALEWVANDNLDANTTTLTVKLYAWRTNTGYTTTGTWGGSLGGAIVCNGITRNSAAVAKTVVYNTWTLMQEETFTLSHAADGALYVSLSVHGGLIAPYTETYLSGGFWATDLILTPNQVSNLVLTRNSDTSHTLTWTRNEEARRPYGRIWVNRWDNVRDRWYEVAELGGGATSYTDSSTVADRQYRYYVDVGNTAGVSSKVYTGYSSTAPAAHENLQWTKSGTNVVLTWTKKSSLTVTTDVDESTDGGATWVDMATVAAGTNTWTHTAPSTATTHIYRVRPIASGVAGAWTTSSVVQLLAAPLAPTGLSPDGPTVDNVVASTVLQWTHSPVDGTAQSAYELRYRVNAGSWVTTGGKVTSAAQLRTIPAATWAHGSTVEWQVKTYGQHADASPWSVIATYTTGARPTATIQTPADDADYGLSTLTAEWVYYDAEGTAQADALVTLLDSAGQTLHTATVAGAAASYVIPATLTNFTEYTLQVAVRDGSGQWSATSTRVFTTDFIPPPAPVVTTSWNPDLGVVVVDVGNPAPSGSEVMAVSNRVWRSVNGAAFELVADDLPVNTSLTDYTPVSQGANTYRVEAVSATPSSAATEVVVNTTSPWLFVSGGPNHSVVARLKGAAVVASTTGREKVLHRFAGRRSPVEFLGEARTRAFSVSGSVDGHGLTTLGSWEAWEQVADLPAPLLFRDPMGRRVLVSISDVGISHEAGSKYAKVTCTLTEVAP